MTLVHLIEKALDHAKALEGGSLSVKIRGRPSKTVRYLNAATLKSFLSRMLLTAWHETGRAEAMKPRRRKGGV